MAETIVDVAKRVTSPLQKGILMNLYRHSDLLGLVPFQPAKALNNTVVRWKTLPTVGSRKLNSGYTESTGTTEQIDEAVRPMGGDVDVEKVFDDLPNVLEKPSVTQLAMKAKAMAFYFNYLFIKGSVAIDADAFYGLEYRISQLPARQKLCIGTMGTPFDATASTANEHAFVDKIIELDDLVGGADVFLCNRKMRLGFGRVLRRLSLLDTTKDAYDRDFWAFDGVPIVDVGMRADKTTEILTETEDPGDEGADTASIYAVKFGSPEGLVGIQMSDLQAYLVAEELESKPVRRWRIDWFVGLAGFGDSYVARLYNLKGASVWT